MIVYKPNGEKIHVTKKSFEIIYKYRGFTLKPKNKDTTKAEIIKELESKKISYNKNDTKANLLELLKE